MPTDKIEEVLKILEQHDGCCMDNEEERRIVAEAIVREMWPDEED